MLNKEAVITQIFCGLMRLAACGVVWRVCSSAAIRPELNETSSAELR